MESFNGKLRDELLNGEIFDTLLEAKVLAERWRQEYNRFRPHSSLGYRPPAPEAVRPAAMVNTLKHPQLLWYSGVWSEEEGSFRSKALVSGQADRKEPEDDYDRGPSLGAVSLSRRAQDPS